MTEPENDTSRNSGSSRMRWWVLAMAAIAVSSSYYESDVIGSVADLLARQRGFSQSQIGMLKLGMEPAAMSPLAFREIVRQDLERWAPIVKASGFTAED